MACQRRGGWNRTILAMALGGVGATGLASAQPVEIPVVQKPNEHEAAQFGYAPWYPVNPPAFDSLNRPYIRSRTAMPHETGYIATIRDGRWVRLDFDAAVKAAYPDFESYRHAGGNLSTRVAVDADDWIYTPLEIRLQDQSLRDIIVYSPDGGATMKVCELSGEKPTQSASIGALNMEYQVGHNTLTRPPLVAALRMREEHPKGRWTQIYNLYLIQPRKEGDTLVMGEPVLVTANALYMSRHAGNPSFAVSTNEKTFFTWAETTINEYVPGVPTFVATFDPETNEVSGQQFVGYGYQPNDGHNSPGIVVDSKGYLHTQTGSHGENFYYSQSLEPYSTEAGMTKPIPALETGWKEHLTERGRQSYLSFICGPDDTLYSVFRQWVKGTSPYYADAQWGFGGLSMQRKSVGQPWEPTAKVLVVPPVDGYALYTHNMAIDRDGRIFITYSYRSDQGLYYNTLPGEFHYQAMLMTPDGGATWRLPTTEDFAAAFASSAESDAQLRPATITGVVLDSEKRPLSGATVSVGPMVVTTDASGNFRCANVLAEHVDIAASALGFSERKLAVDLGRGDTQAITITLDAAARPSGESSADAK